MQNVLYLGFKSTVEALIKGQFKEQAALIYKKLRKVVKKLVDTVIYEHILFASNEPFPSLFLTGVQKKKIKYLFLIFSVVFISSIIILSIEAITFTSSV